MKGVRAEARGCRQVPTTAADRHLDTHFLSYLSAGQHTRLSHELCAAWCPSGCDTKYVYQPPPLLPLSGTLLSPCVLPLLCHLLSIKNTYH